MNSKFAGRPASKHGMCVLNIGLAAAPVVDHLK